MQPIVMPRWVQWFIKILIPVFTALAFLLRRRQHYPPIITLVVCGWAVSGEATGAVVTIPPSARTSNICAALQAEDGCEWEEVAHLKGHVTLIAFDPVTPDEPWNPVLLTAQIRGREISLTLGPASEQHLRDVVDDPATDYHNLMIGSAAWPALRELARLAIDDDVVPILIDGKALQPKVMSLDAVTEAMAETRALRIRIALVQLRP